MFINIYIKWSAWLVFSLLAIVSQLSAQRVYDGWVPFQRGDQWGYVDQKNNICLGFKYDELEFIPSNIFAILDGKDPIRVMRGGKQVGFVESIFKARSGERWGMIDLNAFLPDHIPMPYWEAWEVVPVKYLSIKPYEYGYYFVEYHPGHYGYIRLGPRGRLKEYRPAD